MIPDQTAALKIVWLLPPRVRYGLPTSGRVVLGSVATTSLGVTAALQRLTVRRARVLSLLGIAAASVFTLINHVASDAPLWADLMNLASVVSLGAVLALSAWSSVRARIVPVTMLLVAAGCTVRAVAGVWHGDVAPTAIFLVVLAMTTAATLPWGFWPQLCTAIVAGIAAASNSYILTGGFGPPPGHAAAAVALGLAGSVVLAIEMRRQYLQLFSDNLQRRHAEAELARLNDELERRVEARTAELAAATQNLEREAQERRHANEELHESQRRLQAVLEHADVAIYLRDLDERYLLVNSYWLQLAGRSAEETLGHTMSEIMPAEVATALRKHDAQVLASPNSLQFEELIPQVDGWHTFVSVKFRWLDRDGKPAGIWGLSTEITGLKQVETELRRSEAALSAVIENTHDAIWSIDCESKIRVMNGAGRRLFAKRFGVAFGDRQRVQVPPGLGDEFRVLYGRALAGEHVEVERTFDGPLGREYYLTSLHPIVEDGAVTGATVFSKDVTEQKRIQHEARQRQAELAHVLRLSTMGEMAAGLAHEINQPLGAIANFAQGCVRRLDADRIDAATLRTVVAQIGTEALRAGEIIRRLRALVRKEDTRYEPTDLNHLVREAAQLIEPDVRGYDVDLQLMLDPTLPPVPCNDVQIEQVLLNLLRNAVEAVIGGMDDQRTLVVTTRVNSGQIEVAVRDNGSGIPHPPADVFEPFFTTKSSGLGMGLSISRSIIEAHHGRLWAARNPDRGSTFRFTLPTQLEEEAVRRSGTG